VRKISFFLLPVLFLFASGCSTLMPYHENPLCKRGSETGYCGSVSDVYQQTLREQNKNKGSGNVKKNDSETKKNCEKNCK
jgi:hypothetical protein